MMFFIYSNVRCFKWGVKKTGDVVLRERPVEDQHLVAAISDAASFQSPGFNKKNQHYMNSMFCLYNITIHNCDSVHIQSTSNSHSLFLTSDEMERNNTLPKDYLYLDFNDSQFQPSPLTGSDVGTFSDSFPTSSFYAILWSDSERYSSEGKFEFLAVCNEEYVEETVDGSGEVIPNDF